MFILKKFLLSCTYLCKVFAKQAERYDYKESDIVPNTKGHVILNLPINLEIKEYDVNYVVELGL